MTTIQSRITQNLSPNHFDGREGQTLKAVVLHITGGPPGVAGMNAAVSWFKTSASQVSAHYVIGGGKITQCVELENGAWANGILEADWDASLPWLVEATKHGVNPNLLTVGIEVAGQPRDPSNGYHQARDYTNLISLIQFICATYHIPMTRDRIIGHYQISAHSRANCPGLTPTEWAKLITDCNRKGSILADDGTTLKVKTSTGIIDLVYGFREWWLRERASFGEPTGPMVYDGDGNTTQPFERGSMRWIKATNGFVRV